MSGFASAHQSDDRNEARASKVAGSEFFWSKPLQSAGPGRAGSHFRLAFRVDRGRGRTARTASRATRRAHQSRSVADLLPAAIPADVV